MLRLTLEDYGVDLWEVSARLPEKPDAIAITPRVERGRHKEPLQFTVERLARRDYPQLRRIVLAAQTHFGRQVHPET